MAELNKVTGLIVGQFGEAIQMRVVDSDGNYVNISTYTTSKVLTMRSPDHLKTINMAATFVTDGTDGLFSVTPAASDLDRAGTWEGQLKLEGASNLAFTVPFEIEVEKRLSASS